MTNTSDALETFKSIVPWLISRDHASPSNPEFLHWSEKLWSKGAVLAADEVCKHGPLADDNHVEVALKLFRLWSAHPHVKQGITSHATEIDGPAEPASKAAIWKSYYDLLTAILQHGLTYFPPTDGPERPQFASEIRRVESLYESVLLQEERFPVANALNPLVENWVEQVIRNWEILCGPQWRDEDVGEGGQDSVGRNVLDVSASP